MTAPAILSRMDELAAGLPAAALHGDPSVTVTGLAYDSRLVQPGDLFAALVGADTDGHAYAGSAVAAGAVALLVERQQPLPVPQLIVADSRAALAILAAALYRHPSRQLGVVGITGTDGKTTTSYLVDGIFRAAGYETGMIGTVAVRIGDLVDEHATRQTTPESADVQRYLREMVNTGVRWATLEATSHGLAMHRLDALDFAIAAVTNITHEHLEFHGTVENYRRAKAILFERAAALGSPAVINLDDDGARTMLDYAGASQVITYSMAGAEADLVAADLESDGTGSRFTLQTTACGSSPVELPLIGGFNVANALCAAGIALAAGLPLATVVAALESPPVIPGRMHAIQHGQPFGVIVDYAHTPESLAKVLALLRTLYPGRLIAVFGSAGERDVEKRALQGAVAARLADFSVFTSEDPRNEDPEAIIAAIAEGARGAGGAEGVTFIRVTDRRAAIAAALDAAQPGDCILLAGKGHEGSIIWGREKLPWDEVAVATELLSERGFRPAPGDAAKS